MTAVRHAMCDHPYHNPPLRFESLQEFLDHVRDAHPVDWVRLDRWPDGTIKVYEDIAAQVVNTPETG